MRQLFEYHPVIGYRFVPQIKARVPHESGGYLVRANEVGFRSERPFHNQRTPGVARALLFGDSFTAADGVSNRHRYSDQLEARIANLEIYNYGLPGTGTDQQYLAWQEYAQNIEHHFVIIAVLVENIRRILARYRPYSDATGRTQVFAKPYYTLEGDKLLLHNVPVPREPLHPKDLAPEERELVDNAGRFAPLRHVANALGAKNILQRLTRYQPVPEYASPSTPGWCLMAAILAQWVRAIAKPVVLVPLPLYQHVEETSDASSYQQRFRELARELGCMLHDPLPDLLTYSASERRAFRFESDIHPTPQAHAALAASLAPIVEQLANQQLELCTNS